jgi:beta-lactamase regulating signal transducer with metallopeptidase domain
MNDVALQVLGCAASNAVLATVLAATAWCVHRAGHARVAHALAVLAFLKLVTPPLLPVAVPAGPSSLPNAAATRELATGLPAWTDAQLAALATELAAPAPAAPWPLAVLGLGVAGAVLFLLRAMVRHARFRRALALAEPAAPALHQRLRALAAQMDVAPCPDLSVVAARVSPMLCLLHQRPHVLLPRELLATVSPRELDALLAHELAHASRRDHWVRLLELFATSLYWWLPTTWWLRRTLHAAEERCCDERVLAALPGHGRAYADALLATLDFLAGARRAMPPVACGAGAFSDLKTRLTTIMSDSPTKTMSFTVRALLLAGAAALLPIAPMFAQDDGKGDDKARAELRAALDEIKKLRAEMEAMRAELKRESKSEESTALLDGEPHRHERLRELGSLFAERSAAAADRAREQAEKAVARAKEKVAKIDKDKLHKHLAEIHAHATKQAHKAIAQAHEHLQGIDHKKLHEHFEKAVREATEAAHEASAHAHEHARALHEKLMQGFARGGEATRTLVDELVHRKHDQDVADHDDNTKRERVRTNLIGRLRAEDERANEHAGTKNERLLPARNADRHRADEIQALRKQVEALQAQLEKMAQQQAELERKRSDGARGR